MKEFKEYLTLIQEDKPDDIDLSKDSRQAVYMRVAINGDYDSIFGDRLEIIPFESREHFLKYLVRSIKTKVNRKLGMFKTFRRAKQYGEQFNLDVIEKDGQPRCGEINIDIDREVQHTLLKSHGIERNYINNASIELSLEKSDKGLGFFNLKLHHELKDSIRKNSERELDI